MTEETELVVFPPEAAIIGAGRTALPRPAHTHKQKKRRETLGQFYKISRKICTNQQNHDNLLQEAGMFQAAERCKC